MTEEQLNQIIAQGEGLKVEFKEATDSVPKSVYETVVSFSNTDGGTLLLGVNDDGVVLGIDPNAEAKIAKDLVTALNSRACINPPLYVQPFTVALPSGLVMVVQIQASSQVHDHAGAVYIREFESDLDITQNQQKVSDLYLRKRNFFSESQIYPYLRLEDFDAKLFERARQLIRNYRSDHPWLLESDEQMLKDSSLWRKDFATNQEGYTLAAALIFGKDQTIQSILPAYKAEAMVRIKDKNRWDDRLTLRTNLIDTYLELKGFVNKHLPEKFYLEGDQRIDLRDKIFREVVGNVIVHREYSSALSTDLIIGATEVVITNPNKPLFHGPIDPKSFNPFPKNPNIRKFFTAFGWTDEIGSGIRNTNKFLPLYVPGAKPQFVENDTFKTIIPLQWKTLGDFTVNFQKWLDLPAGTLPHLQKGLTSVALPSALADASWEGIILHLVSSWVRNGTQFPPIGIPENQVFEEEDVRKVPSWAENGTNLLSRKLYYLITILVLSTEPVKTADILKWMKYQNRSRFRQNYIVPLRKVEFLSLTNPDVPNDPDNKYVITEAGKSFLAGM